MSSSETTDLDALESSESGSSATDLDAIESSESGYSGSSDEEYSEYSQCFDSSSSDVDLPDWKEACARTRRDPYKRQTLNTKQREYIHGWANSMLCRTGMVQRVKRFLKYDFPVMSDCSGAEGGILALQALGVKVDHVSSSEINCIATDWIARFSVLRHESDLLGEKAAEPFYAIVKTIGELRVPLYILENVMGIKQCLGEVKAELSKLKGYVHGILEIDSKAIGDVVSRPRMYFIGLHRTVTAPGITSDAKLQNALDCILAKAKKNCTPPTPWHELLLDDPVQEAPIKRRKRTNFDLRYEKLGLASD
ncbi:unnamed protein product [Symbiodinium necroappetens]|uniref:Uncharacterized protein n=1 Tax=Symbiodinium necroappetens TaxID=1628268 RepID=A0A812MSC3_9DINO|nr:unnamed protein product [Symbiodinium necroappetens]